MDSAKPKNRRRRIIIAGLFVGLGIWVFIELAQMVLAGTTQEFDQRIVGQLRAEGRPEWPRGPDWLVYASRDVTSLGGPTLLTLVTLVSATFLILRNQRRMAWILLFCVIGGALLNTTLKETFGRQRPEFRSAVMTESSPSFPSGHAKLSAVVYLTLGVILGHSERRRSLKVFWMILALFLTLIIGLSRVYIGVHYPTDVLAGWIAGTCWAAVGYAAVVLLSDPVSETHHL